MRDVRITGNPEIPAEVVISNPGCLQGWWGYHHAKIEGNNAAWLTPTDAADGAQIIGVRFGHRGWANESLLRYSRPLIEDGSIAYEFYYAAGQTVAHPALDRLAFLLDPNGIQLHWITDGMFERSSLPPDNSFPVSNPQNVAQPLPLRPDAWNSMRLSLAGQTLGLDLNGVKILERQLEETNSRHFGLFHYTERSEMRVRNVVMQGDWPRTLTPVSQQQLADSIPESFDDALAGFSPVFSHNFGTDVFLRSISNSRMRPARAMSMRPRRALFTFNHPTAACGSRA